MVTLIVSLVDIFGLWLVLAKENILVFALAFQLFDFLEIPGLPFYLTFSVFSAYLAIPSRPAPPSFSFSARESLVVDLGKPWS